MASQNDQQRKAREDTTVVSSFVDRYYDVIDNRRTEIDKFYQTHAKLVWNGIELNGRDSISKHLVTLPTTRHQIHAFDYFPMKDLFPEEPLTYQVFTSGAVTYGAPDSAPASKEKRLFSHVVVLTVDGASTGLPIWVIANECFRFHE